MRYDGPIIDAHHHLWDASLGRHPWMTDPDSPVKALGAFMTQDYLMADYLADIGKQPVTGSVFIETGWDRVRPVDEELRWLDSLACPGAIAARRIAWAPLASAQAEAALDILAAHRGVVGVRETIRWHPDPAKRWAEEGLMDAPAWRHGAKALIPRGLLLEVLMNPYQCPDVARLAADLPGLTIVVNHCASPLDRDEASVARWRDGLKLMAAQANIRIKLSNFPAYGVDKSPAALRGTVMTILDAFTPSRAMFGTDYPVGRRAMPYQEICENFRDIAAAFSAAEQRALFHDNAARLYRFDSI